MRAASRGCSALTKNERPADAGGPVGTSEGVAAAGSRPMLPPVALAAYGH
jgi:hypothetical protein